MKKEEKYFVGIIIVVLVIIAAILIITNLRFSSNNNITNFEECIKAGNPAMESYPRQCRANGVTYIEEIDEQKKYVSMDTDECNRIRFMCEEGRKPFFDDSGCGCEIIGSNEEINIPELFIQEAIDKLGVVPIEGFDPDMYKGTFKGLIFEDFNNTEAIGGRWIYDNNKLSFVKESQEITSADGTLTDKGILTLINNLELRLNININTKQDLDSLVLLISKEDGKLVPNYCSNESRNTDVCLTIYEPVCGWSDPTKIQCIKYPCAETYSNSCNACKNSNVLYWTDGECPKD